MLQIILDQIVQNYHIVRNLSCYGFQKVGYTAENCN